MGKRMSFVGFLTIAIMISLLAFACSKKQDATELPSHPDSNTSSESDSPPLPANIPSESNEPNSPASQESPAAGRITAPIEAANQTPAGLITAIAYGGKPSVLIEDELLSEGDTIRGARVVKINEGTVEFEKNGNRWTQQAGETLNTYWSDPNS